MASKFAQGEGMRQKVNLLLAKLSDRDTEAMAAAELDAIARALPPDSIAAFAAALSDCRPSDRPPLRRHCLRLVGVVARAHPPPALAPVLPRLLAAALRRLRDPDSAARAALADAAAALSAAASASGCLASAVLRPLTDALLHEQDQCAQLAAAGALAAAVDAGDDDSSGEFLRRLLPRLLKLLRSNAFKAKPALIALLGSAAAAGGASSPPAIASLVTPLVEFLCSEDWAARKAAAEALTLLALNEKDLLPEFKASSLTAMEGRRFDKVKIVRDSMNRMLEVWKDIPEVAMEDSRAPLASGSQSRPSLRESASANGSVSSNFVQSASPFIARKSRLSSSRSPPPAASPIPAARQRAPPIRNNRLSPPLSRKTERKSSDWRVEIAVPGTPSIKIVSEKKPREQEITECDAKPKLEAKRMLFEKNYEEKGSKLGGLKSASRVVPFQEAGNLESTGGADSTTDEINAVQKEGDLSLIRMQLVQIENQQSSLLDLLQRFIGNSQNGIHSLETRVHGLEMALDEISRDLALSTGRMPNNDPTANTCCSLPGTEFLSPKFWKRNEGRNSSRFSISDNQNFAEKDGKGPKHRLGPQGGFVVNPLADVSSPSRGSTEVTAHTVKNVVHDTGVTHNQDVKKQEEVSRGIRTA